jgi:citrate synthase
MLTTGKVSSDADVRGIDTYLNAAIDHSLNADTFTARTVVSTGSDLVSAATSAIGALKTLRHGGPYRGTRARLGGRGPLAERVCWDRLNK